MTNVPFGISGAEDPVDWESLRTYAAQVMERAYAPYSQFRVGAAGLVDDGRVVPVICSALHSTGGGRLRAVACVDGEGEPLMPCGRCRQLLWENGGPAMELLTPSGVRPMSEVLPDAFGAHDLDDR